MGKIPPKKQKPKGWRGEAGISFQRGKTPDVSPRTKSEQKKFTPNPSAFSKVSIDALREQIIANARAKVAREEWELNDAYERMESEREKRDAVLSPALKQNPSQAIRGDLLESIFLGREKIFQLRKKILDPKNGEREVDMDALHLLRRKQLGLIQKFNTVSDRLNLPALKNMDYRNAYREFRARRAAEKQSALEAKAEARAKNNQGKNGNKSGKKK